MKNLTLATRAVYAAFVRVLCAIPASFLNLKGGGGAENRRALARVFGGIFAVFCAMPFAAEEANAQAAECAQFDVFTPSSGMPVLRAPAGTWDVSGTTLADIVMNLMDANTLPDNTLRIYFAFGEFPQGTTIPSNDFATGFVGGLPTFSSGSLAAGGFLTLLDGQGSLETGFQEPFRLYADTVGGDLRLATLPAEKKCAADLNSGNDEFFLHSTDYTPYDSTATPSATTYIGYEAPDCGANDMFDDGTGLACRDAIDTGECKMLNSLHVFDADMGMCRPTESRDCTGGDVFHINDCFANCPADFNDDDGDGVCDADIVQTLNCGTGAFLNSDNMCECTDDNDSLNADGLSCSARPPQTQPAAAADESDDEGFPAEDALIAYGGVFGVVLAAHFLWDGNPNAFAFSPDVGYSLTESGYSFNAGGRMDFHKDRWHLYWTAGQANTNGDTGDFRYSSGGSYAADFWTATFSENASGEIVDYDLSLSANYGEGIWKLSPVYRLHSRFKESENGRMESETTNSLNLEGILRANRWILRPSAGFQWRGMDDFADNARFGLSAVRNL